MDTGDKTALHTIDDAVSGNLLDDEVQALGDIALNGDTQVDDFDALALAFMDARAYEAPYGAPSATNGGVDRSGDSDVDDIGGFVEFLNHFPGMSGTSTGLAVVRATPDPPAPSSVRSRRMAKADGSLNEKTRTTHRLIAQQQSDAIWSDGFAWLDVKRHGRDRW
jgi:hypothetical protein